MASTRIKNSKRVLLGAAPEITHPNPLLEQERERRFRDYMERKREQREEVTGLRRSGAVSVSAGL